MAYRGRRNSYPDTFIYLNMYSFTWLQTIDIHNLDVVVIKRSKHQLTHWGRMTHIRIYASVDWTIIGSKMACRLVGAKPLSEPMLEYRYVES